jgi:hypothetical protein
MHITEALVKSYTEKFPAVWKRIEQARVINAKDFGLRPPSCYVGIADVIAGLMAVDGLPKDEGMKLSSCTLVGAIANWRPSKGVYAFGPAAYAIGRLPGFWEVTAETFLLLPEFGIYLELDGLTYSGHPLTGGWFFLDQSNETKGEFLRLCLGVEGGAFVTAFVPMRGISMRTCMEFWKSSIPQQFKAFTPTDTELQEVFARVAYLCRYSSDARTQVEEGRHPARPFAPGLDERMTGAHIKIVQWQCGSALGSVVVDQWLPDGSLHTITGALPQAS